MEDGFGGGDRIVRTGNIPVIIFSSALRLMIHYPTPNLNFTVESVSVLAGLKDTHHREIHFDSDPMIIF
jgi:hypothetical protein